MCNRAQLTSQASLMSPDGIQMSLPLIASCPRFPPRFSAPSPLQERHPSSPVTGSPWAHQNPGAQSCCEPTSQHPPQFSGPVVPLSTGGDKFIEVRFSLKIPPWDFLLRSQDNPKSRGKGAGGQSHVGLLEGTRAFAALPSPLFGCPDKTSAPSSSSLLPNTPGAT